METTKKCSLLIVGGGPAGLSCAISAAQMGIKDILLVEKKKSWGIPVQCAEYVPAFATTAIEIPSQAIARSTPGIDIFMDGQPMPTIPAPGLVLHRDIWEAYLAGIASNLGVESLQPASFLNLDRNYAVIQATDKIYRVEYQILIGADGPSSLVRKAMGFPINQCELGIQHTLEVCKQGQNIEIYFDRMFGLGYGWLCPKDGVKANIGIVVKAKSPNTQKVLREFLTMLLSCGRIDKLPESQPSCMALIPGGKPMKNFVVKNAVLVGDAAGHVNALTRAGIYPGLVCGKIAGKCAAQAIAQKNSALLKDFDKIFADYFQDYFIRAWHTLNGIKTSSQQEYRDTIMDGFLRVEGELIQFLVSKISQGI